MSELTSFAEMQALKAETLPAFSPVKILHIKRSVAEILRLFGTSGIFEQYTRHDISHLDAMLASLTWLVPDESKEHMQAADWLLLVLAVYFHDLGLLVTKDEY